MRRFWRLLAPGVAAIGLAGQAAAHPHVWIEIRSDVIFNDEGKITGINLIWSFDDGYTQVALEGLDTNGDGVYSQQELDPLTKENIASLKDYEYFTVMRVNGEKVGARDTALKAGDCVVLQVGKRKFARVTLN